MSEPTVQDTRPIVDKQGRVLLISPWGEKSWVTPEEGFGRESIGAGYQMVRDPAQWQDAPTGMERTAKFGLGVANSLSAGLLKQFTDLSAELSGQRGFQRSLEESDEFTAGNIVGDIGSLLVGPIKAVAGAAGKAAGSGLSKAVLGKAVAHDSAARAKAAESVLLAETVDDAARLSLDASIKENLLKTGSEYANLVKRGETDLARELVKGRPEVRDVGVAIAANVGEIKEGRDIASLLKGDKLKNIQDDLAIAAAARDGDNLRRAIAGVNGDIGAQLAGSSDRIKFARQQLSEMDSRAMQAGKFGDEAFQAVRQSHLDGIEELEKQRSLLQVSARLDESNRQVLQNLQGADESANALMKARHNLAVTQKAHKVDLFGRAIVGGAVEGALVSTNQVDSEQGAAYAAKEILAGAALGAIWNGAAFGVGLAVDKAKKAIIRKSGVDPDLLEKTLRARRFYERRVGLAKQTGDAEELRFAMENVDKLSEAVQSMRTQMFKQSGESATLMSKVMGYASGGMVNHVVGALAYGTIGSMFMAGSLGGPASIGAVVLTGALTGAVSRTASRRIQDRIWNSMIGGKADNRVLMTARKMAKYGSYRTLTNDEIGLIGESLDDSQNVYRDAKVGYTLAGVDPIETEALAQVAARQNDVLVKYTKRENLTRAQQNEASLAVALASDPNTLPGLISSGTISERAMKIYEEMFPTEANRLRAQAIYIKKEFSDSLSLRDRRLLATISGQRKSTAMLMQQMYQKPPAPAPSTKKPDNRQWTEMQRINAGAA